MFKLQEIMEMLSIPERTIRRHIKLGLLKGEKVGGTWRFSEDDLQNYFSNKIIQQTQRHNKFKEIIDYLNGISKFDNQLLIIKQAKRFSMLQNKELSSFVSTFTNPFYFDIDSKMNKSIITFRGAEQSAILLLKKIESL
jgi:excisionase family DNA binding protein